MAYPSGIGLRMGWATCVGVMTVGALGCRVESSLEQRWASQASDSVDVVASESALLVPATEGLEATTTPEDAASAAAAQAGTFYQPPDCVSTSATGRTVAYALNDCTGPHGVVHVTGTVSVEYASSTQGLAYHATSTGLQVNGATMNIDNEGTVSVTGDTVTVQATTSGEGVGPRGNHFVRTGTYSFSWTSTAACLSLDGAWSTVVNDARSWSTTVSGYRRCGSECPREGGSIEWRGALNSLTVTFDGSDVASWETGRGRTGTVDLFCSP